MPGSAMGPWTGVGGGSSTQGEAVAGTLAGGSWFHWGRKMLLV